MGQFKLICCNCGSENVLEKSCRDRLGCEGAVTVYGEGIQRKCTDCGNEDFAIFKTWKE